MVHVITLSALLSCSGLANAETKSKMIGVWELRTIDGECAPAGPIFIEFTRNGNVKIVVIAADAIGTGEGTYEIDCAKVKTRIKERGGEEAQETREIRKLTKTDLVLINQEGKKESYKRK
jgi:uncharacterized protein (TIGR03066 family)